MYLSPLNHSYSQRYLSIYGIIINKTQYRSDLILSILTPNLGIIQASLKTSSSFKKSSTLPITYQQLNLIEGVLKKSERKKGHYHIQELTLIHSFFGKINPSTQWILIHMFTKLYHRFYIYQHKEHYKLFMLSLKLLETVGQSKNLAVNEILCLSALVKSVLITKMDTSLFYCGPCHQKIWKMDSQIDISQYKPLGFDLNRYDFICPTCLKKGDTPHYQELSFNEYQLLRSIFTQTLESIKNESEEYQSIFPYVIKYLNFTIYNLFQIHWYDIVDKEKNPFLL